MKTFFQLLLLGLVLQACFADHRVDVGLPKEYKACCGLEQGDSVYPSQNKFTNEKVISDYFVSSELP